LRGFDAVQRQIERLDLLRVVKGRGLERGDLLRECGEFAGHRLERRQAVDPYG
jgi:hypothetical protein